MSAFVKLLQSILLFVALSISIFFLKNLLPNDPVEQSLGIYSENEFDDRAYSDSEYRKEAIKLGLDKPKFYFGFIPSDWSAEYQKLLIPQHKKIAHALISRGLKWEDIDLYLKAGQESENKSAIMALNSGLLQGTNIPNNLDFGPNYTELLLNIYANKKRSFYYPFFQWHGIDNQYHHWIKTCIDLKNNLSNIDNKPAGPKISSALKWTLSITLPTLFLSFFFGIFLGFQRVISKSKIWDYLQNILDLFHSLPLFWFATLLVIFFTTDDYGQFTNIFPSIHSMSFSTGLGIFNNLKYLLLPILCYILLNVGYISALMTSSLRDQLSKPFILTAQLKGLTKKQIIKQHGLKNAMFPIVTLFTSAIPASFAGSLILEIIFNIPGVGRLLYRSILLADWNIGLPVLLLLSAITIISYWVADIIYAKIDPKSSVAKA